MIPAVAVVCCVEETPMAVVGVDCDMSKLGSVATTEICNLNAKLQ